MGFFRSAIAAAAWAASLALPAVPASAAGGRELSCQEIVKTDDGRFTYRPAGFSILAKTRSPGPFVYDNTGGVVAFSCARTEIVPQPDDVEVLQAGYDLTIGSMRGALVLLELSVADGRITHSVSGGELSPRERRALEAVLVRFQERLAASPPVPQPAMQ